MKHPLSVTGIDVNAQKTKRETLQNPMQLQYDQKKDCEEAEKVSG